MALTKSSRALLSFTEQMRHENIRSISMFLIQKYLDQEKAVGQEKAELSANNGNMPLFLGILSGEQ